MQKNGEAYLRGLREDHARFSRILSMIGRDARRLVDEPEAVLPLFAEAVDYVVSFQNVYHHPREEIMFAKIAAASESLATAATRLTREHHATTLAGKELLSLMDATSRAPSSRANRTQLARSLERFARAMRGHIAQEEELLYSNAWTELTPQDWDALAGSAAAVDPLEGTPDSRYPLLASYVSEGQTRSNVSMPSTPLGQVVESGLKRAVCICRPVRFNQQHAEAPTSGSLRALKKIRQRYAACPDIAAANVNTGRHGACGGVWPGVPALAQGVGGDLQRPRRPLDVVP